MTKPMRFGVCGTAFWAENVHIPGLKINPSVDVVGVWGRTYSRTAELAAATGIRAFSSFEEMLDAVDAVSFVVPPDVQSNLAQQAAEAGRHLLLEKPIAADLQRATALIRTIERKGVSGLCFLTRMFVPQVQAFMQKVRALKHVSGEASFRSGALLEGPYAGSQWRQSQHGALWDAAPHGMSVLVGGLGPIVEVSARLASEGTYTLKFEHAAGARSTLDLNLRDPSVKLAESYRFSNGETTDLAGLQYNRKETFTRASDILVRAVQGGGMDDDTQLGLALHLVAVAEAAEESLLGGGRPILVPATS